LPRIEDFQKAWFQINALAQAAILYDGWPATGSDMKDNDSD
jgi:hypothetical protein